MLHFPKTEPAGLQHTTTPNGLLGVEQPALVVERIEIQGATKTRPEVIHRYLTIRIGAEITPEMIERDYQALNATNFFKQVHFSSKPGSERGKVVLVIEVVERRWPWLEVAGGFSELEGWYLIPLGIRFDNLFGRGNFSGARFLVADRSGGFYLHFRQPQVFDEDFDLLVEIGSRSKDFIHYLDNRPVLQKVEDGSVNLGLIGTRGLARHFSLGLNFHRMRPANELRFTQIDSTLRNLPPELAPVTPEQKINNFYLRLQTDSRDDSFFPRSGIWGALSFDVADSSLGSDLSFKRIVFDGRLYHSWGKSVLAFHAKLGAISEAAPFYERFYLGGAYSLRGFAERSLTPLGWGTDLFLAQAELRIPVSGTASRPSLFGALFVDAGRLDAGEWQEKYFATAGFGFRLKVPIIGLLRCDFAYPLDRDDFRFHLSLGQTF